MVNSFGRANIPNQSVFYCSTNEETVVHEVTQWYINNNGRAQDLMSKGVMKLHWSPFNAFMTISAWVVKEPMTLAILFNGKSEIRGLDIKELNIHRSITPDFLSEDFHKSFNLVLDFFSQRFGKLDISHELEYVYSAFYANEVYNDNISRPKLDGVQYGSVANNYRGENFALSEDSFLNKIEFVGANFCYSVNRVMSHPTAQKTAIIGRFNSALLQKDKSLYWQQASNTYDYIQMIDGKPIALHLPPYLTCALRTVRI